MQAAKYATLTNMLVTVDTGGTKTLIAGFEQNGKMGDTTQFPTPKNQNDYVTVLREAIQKKYKDHKVEAVVIALPGIIKDGVAIWCNNLEWKDFDALAAFHDVLGDVPVFIENDANLAGLAETRILEPVPVSSLYVTISTGIGTGFITNGRIDPGLRLSEGGRMLIEFTGSIQEWEDFASGQAIKNTYGKFARDIDDESIWREIADRISRGFLTIIPLAQPEIVIIGGSIGTYFEAFAPTLTALLEKHLPPHIPCPLFKQARHPEQAVLYGCYYYAIDSLTH